MSLWQASLRGMMAVWLLLCGLILLAQSAGYRLPHAGQIAYAALTDSGDYDIFLLDVGLNLHQRMTTLPRPDTRPLWSPAGDRLLFYRDFLYGTLTYEYLFVMSGNGRGVRPLERGMTGRGTASKRPVWSPDGTRFAVVIQDLETLTSQIYVMDLDTEAIQPVTDQDDIRPDTRPVWSPDGDYLRFVTVSGDDYRVYETQPGQFARHIGGWTLPGDSRLVNTPLFSPQADRVLLSIRLTESDYADLYLYDLADEQLTRLTRTPNQAESRMTWTADGTGILYILFEPGEESLMAMDPDTGDAERWQIVSAGKLYQLVAAPDGERVLTLSREGALCLVNRDGQQDCLAKSVRDADWRP